jgi:hypothetical protein
MELFKKKISTGFVFLAALLSVAFVMQIVTCHGILKLSERIDRESKLWEEEARDFAQDIFAEGVSLAQGMAEYTGDLKESGEHNAREVERSLGSIITERNEGVRAILIEKVVFDYVQTGLEYFKRNEYLKAYDIFSRALRYQRGNTTLQFYQIYSRYLGAIDKPLTEREREAVLASGILLGEATYREEEYLEFTGEEMKERAKDIAYNIREIHRRETGGDDETIQQE